jgi:hypothetical protein
MPIQTASALWLVAALGAPAAQPQPYEPPKPRRHFVSFSYERQYIQPYSFRTNPLSELLGQPVDEAPLEGIQYRTRDQSTTATVREYGKRADAIGATIYPFGSSSGTTLALRGSISSLPDIRVEFDGPAAPAPTYVLTDGRAFDVGAGIDVSDRSAGWGIGAHAFVIGGIGRIEAQERDGTRYFVEGGGGVVSGPFGVDIAFKYTINRFSTPISHSIHMIPISVRGTLSF